ncbi:MAG: hypothetical protein JW956_02475 [Calditrichaceae bacterium]|nr:hypothetical protein [Calditrichaceae bacterium]
MKTIISLALSILFLACQMQQPATNIEPAKLFSDHMVLQRTLPVNIWGSANPNGILSIEFNGQSQTTVSDQDGKWKFTLQPMQEGGPYEMKIAGKDTIILKDILIGEVWIGSGQSNMEMPLAGWGQVMNYEQEIAAADYPNIRLFQVYRTIGLQPERSIPSDGWKVCTPENVSQFSSTEYFFGRELFKELNVPIGLIHSSWGGTIIEAWMSSQGLKDFPEYQGQIDQLKKISKRYEEKYKGQKIESMFAAMMKERDKEINNKELGMNDPEAKWSEVDIDISQWKTMQLPDLWENQGLAGLDGIVWFRKEVDLPKEWTGKGLTLHISAVDDIDSTFFNGVFVGTHNVYNEPRIYSISKDLVKAGKNVIAVKVRDDQGGGGIWADPKLLKISLNESKSISLTGEWFYRVGLDYNELDNLGINPNNPNYPTLLSNAMIEPLIPFAFRGVIWYQGESNAGAAYKYRSLFPALVQDWRQRWGQGDFPFLFVQLANYKEVKPQPGDDDWAELREAQLMSLNVPNTGMAVTIDIGDAQDIHPKNKQEVGRRLTLNALKIAYNKDIVFSGPIYKSMKIKGSKIELTFDHVADGLKTADGKALKGFSIAGADKQFKWAKAKIENDKVIVWHPDVKNPAAVRYAWASNPICNLVNSANLPASPFRTDDWPGITQPE